MIRSLTHFNAHQHAIAFASFISNQIDLASYLQHMPVPVEPIPYFNDRSHTPHILNKFSFTFLIGDSSSFLLPFISCTLRQQCHQV